MANSFAKGQGEPRESRDLTFTLTSGSKPTGMYSHILPLREIVDLTAEPSVFDEADTPQTGQAVWTIHAGSTGAESHISLDGVPCFSIKKAVLTIEAGQRTTLRLTHARYAPAPERDPLGEPVYPQPYPNDFIFVQDLKGQQVCLEWGGRVFALKEVSQTNGQ